MTLQKEYFELEEPLIFEKVRLFTLTRDRLFLAILLFIIIVNILVLFNINFLHIRALLVFLFLILIPGFLIMLCFKIRSIRFWEYLIYTVGLSIAFIMFIGFAVNEILPWLHISDKPLTLYPIIICFNIFLIVLWITGIKMNGDLKSFDISFPKLDAFNNIFYTIPIIFPFLSIIGALILNNNGTNYLTMVLLGSIALYVLVLILVHKKIDKNIYPYIIFILSISLLIMYSMRSWHITGFDIHNEFKVFQITKQTGIWSMSHFPGFAYNACLSITILPTIISILTKINDEYIYKLIFPIIFALTPVAIYLFINKYISNIAAFLSSFFFISQIWFIQQMPALARQEIALLFFCIILLLIFSDKITTRSKIFLFTIFTFCMVTSHYTTTYIATGLVCGAFLLGISYKKLDTSVLFYRLRKKKLFYNSNEITNKYYIPALYLVIIILLVIFWSGPITKTSNQTINVFKLTIEHISESFDQDSLVNTVETFAFKQKNVNNYENLQKMINNTETQYKSYKINSYSSNIISTYQIKLAPTKNVVPIIKNNSYNHFSNWIYRILVFVINIIFIPVGILYLAFRLLRKKHGIDVELFMIIILSILVLLFLILIPFSASKYNLSRAYLQALVTLSLPAIFGGLAIFSFIPKLKTSIVTILFVLFFLASTGFFFQIFGGGITYIHLNNYGDDFDKLYTHEQEVKSAVWLSHNIERGNLLYADEIANLRLDSFSTVEGNRYDILPFAIDKNAYVYLIEGNFIKTTAYKRFKDDMLRYNYPLMFLNNNKNLIYNNGGSVIFK